MDFEKLSEYSTIEQASYEIFCSKLNQPKSNIRGYLYFWYGYNKVTVETIYNTYSQDAFYTITQNVTNTITKDFKNIYESYINQYRDEYLKIDDYEHYYVAQENNTMRTCKYEIL